MLDHLCLDFLKCYIILIFSNLSCYWIKAPDMTNIDENRRNLRSISARTDAEKQFAEIRPFFGHLRMTSFLMPRIEELT
jgi:hypothetical protein